MEVSPSPPLDRTAIDTDSTAVLAFDDGVRVPCDRFLVRSLCSVVRRLLEDAICDLDPRGRSVIPVPLLPSAPFWHAMDVLHGCVKIDTLDLPSLLGVAASFEFLGASAFDAIVDAQLWVALRPAGFEVLLAHVPRLLRNPTLAPAVVQHLIVTHPMWADFRERVLGALKDHADPAVLTAIMHYAPNYFPPALVANWVLDAWQGADAELVKLVSHHGVMYHPCETPEVLRRVANAMGDASLRALLKMACTSAQTFEGVPWTSGGARGSLLSYTDTSMVSVSVQLEPGRLPSRVRAARWLRLHLCQDGRLDVCFEPRRIEGQTSSCMQLRVMALDAPGLPVKECVEAWWMFDIQDDDGDEAYTLAHAVSTMGNVAGLTAMLRQQSVRQLRLDFFYGSVSVLDKPFDVAKCHTYVTV